MSDSITPYEALKRAENSIRQAADRCLPHASLSLFGSRARGQAGRRSDFDLAILPRKGYSLEEALAFTEALEASPDIIYPVDVVDYEQASQELRHQIEKEGILWKD